MKPESIQNRLSRTGRRVARAAVMVSLVLQPWEVRTSPLPQEGAPLKFQKPLTYEVSAVLKLVHVYVTDKKGKPVRNLTRDDFTVTDNGRPVILTEFEMHTLAPSAGENARRKPDEIGFQQRGPGAPAVREENRKFFLFFDLAFNNVRGMKKAKKAALHFLDETVGPDDEVGVLSYSVFKGVSVHEYLTRDHGKVREVLERIDQGEVVGRAEEIEDWHWRLAQEPAPPWEPPGKIPYYVLEELMQREELKKTAQNFIHRLTDLAKSLRYVPGQKQLILFSTGVPSPIIYGHQAGIPDVTTRAGTRYDAGALEIRNQNEAMYREFAASGCSFFTFDTRESAKSMDLFLYDKQTFEIGYRGVFIEDKQGSTANDVLIDEKTTGINPLKRLSNLTGGRYYANINRYEDNLNQVQELTGTYYVLGYPINEQWDGRFHEVKVGVREKGCEVRAQAGYFNPKPFREFSGLEKQLQLYDLALNGRAFSRIPAVFAMSAYAFGPGERSKLGILARIPGDVAKSFTGKKTELVAIVFDGKGDIRDVIRREADLGSGRGQDAVLTVESALPPGDYACRIVIRDMDTGTGAVASAGVTIGCRPADGLVLSTPLLLEEGTCSFLAGAVAGKTGGVLTFGDAYPYDKTLFSPVPAEMPLASDRVQALIPFSVSGVPEPEIALTGYLINSNTGERSALAFYRTGRITNGPLGCLAVEFPVVGIPPGKYFLHFHAQDRVSKFIGHASTSLLIAPR